MKVYTLLLLPILLTGSCSEELLPASDQPCPELICTADFRSVTVKFTDASGNPIVVKDFSSVIKRTGKVITQPPLDQNNFKGIYPVVTDNDVKNLVATGDIIEVSATNPTTNEKKTIEFVVAGGPCACHVEKKSGPTEIVF